MIRIKLWMATVCGPLINKLYGQKTAIQSYLKFICKLHVASTTLYWYTALTYFVRGVLTDQNKGQGSLVNADNKLWWYFVGSDNLGSFFIKGEPL